MTGLVLVRKRVPKCCVYALSIEKCRAREHLSGAFVVKRVKNVEEESTEVMYLQSIE